jgi:signal transduction histidine kinase/CheY-like chemotaxis protein
MPAREMTVWLLRVAIAAAVVVPCLLFAYASWLSYHSANALADERIVRSLDVQQEQAVKAFQLIDNALNGAADLVAGLSDEQIRAEERRLHFEFGKLVRSTPVIQSIWIYDRTGVPLVTSWVEQPPVRSFADRDFFQAQIRPGTGLYYGKVYPSEFNAQPFFTVSRRLEKDGAFIGVLEVSVLPSNFVRFFSTLAYTQGLQYALLRDDGAILARYPDGPGGAPDVLDEHTGFRRTIARVPEGGLYTTTSPVDRVERRFGVRRFGNTPVYLSAGIASSTIQGEWLSEMASHLIFGIPATLLLFLTLFAVLKRTQRLYKEMDRRLAVEEALRQSQKMEAIGQLTGGVAHDFNNLLTIIIGNLDTAQRQMASWGDEAHQKLALRLENAMHGAKRAATLTRRLLAFSRQQPLNPTSVDVNRLLNGMSEFVRRSVTEDIAFEIVGGAGLWTTEVDPAELEAAILNLIVNAKDAMRDGGKLTIEASNSYLDDAYCKRHPDLRPGQYVLIAVSDTGSGMQDEVVKRAFDPFFTTKQAGEGTGLGLSQVYGFVKQSGGHAKIYSEPGEGTTVKLYLPRCLNNKPTQDQTRREPPASCLGERILVAEDDEDVREYVTDSLQELGYEVFEAENGENALKILDQHSVNLLLTDVVMPGMNGRKLADEVKRRHPDLRVLFMTGYSRNAIVHQGRLDSGVDLVQKPLSTEQLANAVRKALDH